jgi:hypothetical protein
MPPVVEGSFNVTVLNLNDTIYNHGSKQQLDFLLRLLQVASYLSRFFVNAGLLAFSIFKTEYSTWM